VHSIVQAHRGTVSVDSAEGLGTTFRLTFPAAGAPPTAAAAPVAAPAERPLRVLVVDDEPRLARMAALVLRRLGHAAVTAGSAEEALAVLQAAHYDAVVSDLSMGAGLNGWDLAAAVRARWPATRVVLATGWSAGIDPEAARGRGVAAVLAKPYRAADLQRTLSVTP
jgi:CheY-like chemotaxis protein